MKYYLNKTYKFLKLIGALFSLSIIQALPMIFLLLGNKYISIAMSFVIITFMFVVYKKNNYSIENLNKDVILYSISFILFAVVSLSIVSFVFNLTETTANQKTIESLLNISPIIVFINSVIIAPMIEEFIFRNLFFEFFLGNNYEKSQKLYMKSKRVWFSIMMTSIGFAVMHQITSISSFLIYMILGIGLAVIRAKSNKIEYSVASHMAWNTLVFIVMVIQQF